MVTSLWTILLCFPSTTPYVVTNVITNVFTVCTLDNHINLEARHVFVRICLASP